MGVYLGTLRFKSLHEAPKLILVSHSLRLVTSKYVLLLNIALELDIDRYINIKVVGVVGAHERHL